MKTVKKLLSTLPILVVALFCCICAPLVANAALDSPANITLIPTGDNLTVSWDKMGGATGYDIEVDGNVLDNGGSTTFQHNGMNPESSHTYRIRSVEGEVDGDWTTLVTVSMSNMALTPVIAIDNTTPVNTQDTVTISNWGNVVAKRYRINGQGWLDYKDPFTISENCIIEAFGIDRIGKISGLARFKVTNIDKAPPTRPFIKIISRDVSQKSATFAIIEGNDLASGVKKTQYRLADGDWIDYSAPVTVNYGQGSTLSTRSIDRAGNMSLEYTILLDEAVATDTQAPSVPTGIVATEITQTSVSFKWNASTDNVGVKGYEVYRDGVKVGTAYNPNYIQTPLSPGKSYAYTLRAFDQSGNISYESDPLTVTTKPDTQPPSTPTEITTLRTTQTSTLITWRASTDDLGIKGYEIYRDGEKIAFTTDWQFTNTLLKPNTSYYYSVKAVDLGDNVSGMSEGIVVTTYADEGIPTMPTNLRVVSKTDTSITLSWDAATDNVGIKGYEVYRDGVRVTRIPNTTFTVSPLSVGKSYIFTVKAYDVSGNLSDSSNSLTVTTESDTKAPSIPANLRVTSSTETSVSLAWNASTDNVAVAGYEVYRNGVKIGTTPGITFTSIPLTPAKSYTFTVKAYDAKNNFSEASTAVTGTTLPDTQAPTIPSGLTATCINETSVEVQWNASTDNVALYGYAVYRNGTRINTVFDTKYVYKSLSPNTSYTFGIVAIDSTPNYSNMSEPLTVLTLADTTPPAEPTNLRQTAKTETSVTITWDAATDNFRVAGYTVYRNGVKATTIPGLTFTDTPLTIGKSYTYTVKAYDTSGNYSAASTALVASTEVDTKPPTAPTNVTATATETSIALRWTASTDNSWITGYEVYRDGVKVGSTPGLSYTISPLTPGKSYTFTVKAYDSVSIYSEPSTPLTVSTLSDTLPPTTPTQLEASNVTETTAVITWAASTDNTGIRGYKLFRNDILVANPTSTSVTATWLTPGTTYVYTIKAIDLSGNESQVSTPLTFTTLNDTQAPSIPTEVTVSTTDDTSVTLVWTASTDNAWVAGYYIYRDGVKVGSAPGNITYTNNSLSPGKTYHYTVRAYDVSGNVSGDSIAVEATTTGLPQPPPPPEPPVDTQEPPTGDTTTDGSTTDGSTTDGSTTNGSTTDESTTDGSTTDESTTDGSTTDGSTTDGSATDGSTTDGSTTDGSTTDGSATDGSITDGSTTDGSTTGGSTTDESTTDESTTDESITDELTTDESITDESTTGELTTDESTTDESTTDESVTGGSTTDGSTTDESTTGDVTADNELQT